MSLGRLRLRIPGEPQPNGRQIGRSPGVKIHCAQFYSLRFALWAPELVLRAIAFGFL